MFKLLFKAYLLLVVVLFAKNAFCQQNSNNILIKGTLKDSRTQEKLPYFPFKLYHTQLDSVHFIGDYISNAEGSFSVGIAKYSKIIWQSNSPFFSPLEKSVLVQEEKTIDLGEIFLISNDTIESIEVKTALIRNDGQKISFDVGSLGLPENMETAMILQMTPMLSMGQDGNYKLQGVKEVIFYLDGQRSTLETIRSLPSEAIDKIEVLPNPSLYEVSGKAALVNVITKSNVFISKGSLNGSVGLLRELYSGNLNFMMKNRKTMLNFTTGISQIKLQGDWQLDRNRLVNNTSILRQNGKNESNTLTQNLNLSFFHNFNSTWKINGQFLLFQTQAKTNNHLLINQVQPNLLFRSSNQTEKRDPLYSFTTELKKIFSKKFTTTLAFSGSIKNEPNNLENTDEFLLLRNRNDTKIQQGAVQWLNQWKINQSNKLEVGLIYSTLVSESNFKADLQNLQDGTIAPFNPNTGFLNFNQKITYGFVGYNFLHKAWTFNAESRLEHTSNRIAITNNDVSRDFWNFLPRITITRDLESYGNLSLVYNRRIHRPEAQSLNPFITINNPNFNYRGNNALQNEIENDFSLSYNISPNDHSYFDMSLSYNRWDNVKVYRTTTATDTLFERSYQNINFYDETKLNISYNTRIKDKLSLNLNNYLSFFNYKSNTSDNKFNQGLVYQIDFSTSYIFPKNWIAFFSVSYLTKDMGYQEYKERLPLLYWSVSKSIFKEKLNLSLGVGDIFNWNGKIKTYYNDLTFKQNTVNKLNFRYIDFSIRYNFGKKFQDLRRVEGLRL